MTGEQHIDYETLAQDAIRGIVRTVLVHVAKSGLPGEHHFYIAFNTNAPGASISKRLKEKYPEEMTIVLQHRFWDLIVNEERFEVKLTFDGIPERLVVPFTAIKVFFDPSVPYGLQFEGSDLASDPVHELEAEEAGVLDVGPRYGAARTRRSDPSVEQPSPDDRVEKKARSPRKPRAGKGEGAAQPSAKPADVLSAGSTAEAAFSRQPGRPKLGTSNKSDPPDPPANDTKIVHLDKFRKK